MSKMRIRVILLFAALFGSAILAAVPAAPLQPSFLEAAKELDGDWRGGDFVLRIDARRAQASVDPSRPFEWEHFLIKEVNDREIVFAIGADLFEAKLETDVLTLTGTGFRGARVLFREPNLRGTTSE
jgi:hypothetical protein